MEGIFRVKDCMTTRVITLTPETNIFEAVQTLLKHDISGAPVVNQTGKLIGILSEHDCIKVTLQRAYFEAGGGKVKDFMSEKVVTVNPNADIISVAQKFLTYNKRRFPVVDRGELVGQISRRDILAIMEKFVERATKLSFPKS